MTYIPQTWADGNPAYPVSAARMAYIEAGLAAVANGGSLAVIPEKYGAVGDGVTDDTAALKLWIASGLNLALTPGKTYLHRNQITFQTAGQVLNGNGATLKRAAQFVTTTTSAIVSGVTTSITLASVAGLVVGDNLICEKAGTYDPAAPVVQSIVGNVVTFATPIGISSASGTVNVRSGWGQIGVIADDVRITNCLFDGNSANWSWARWNHTCAIFISGNHVLVDHNKIFNQYGDGCSPGNTVSCWFVYNNVENIQGRGCSWAGGPSTYQYGGRCLFNRFYNCDQDTNVGGTDGNGCIQVSSNNQDLLIHGNQMESSYIGVGSVNSPGNSDITISDNVIRTMSAYAIEGIGGTNSNASNVLIEGNRIYSAGSINIQAVGSSQTGGSKCWSIRGNLLIETNVIIFNLYDFVIEGNAFYSTGTALSFVSLGGGAGESVYLGVVANNRFEGGKYAVLISTNCGQITATGNMCVGQNLGGLRENSALPAIAFKDNTVISTAASDATNYNAIYSCDADVSGNYIDFSANGGHGIALTNTSTKAVVRNNRFVSGGHGNITNASGCSNAVIEDNQFDNAWTDNGTNTRKRGNRYSTGQSSGKAVLVGGTVTVSTAEVQAGDVILLTNVLTGGTIGILSVGTIVAGTSFVINSNSGSDTSTLAWQIVH
jgi:hypothetical protein